MFLSPTLSTTLAPHSLAEGRTSLELSSLALPDSLDLAVLPSSPPSSMVLIPTLADLDRVPTAPSAELAGVLPRPWFPRMEPGALASTDQSVAPVDSERPGLRDHRPLPVADNVDLAPALVVAENVGERGESHGAGAVGSAPRGAPGTGDGKESSRSSDSTGNAQSAPSATVVARISAAANSIAAATSASSRALGEDPSSEGSLASGREIGQPFTPVMGRDATDA